MKMKVILTTALVAIFGVVSLSSVCTHMIDKPKQILINQDNWQTEYYTLLNPQTLPL